MTVAAIVDGVTGTASLTVNTPVSAPPTGDVASRILGVTPSATEVRSLGGMFTQYEDNFVTYDEQQWATNGARWMRPTSVLLPRFVRFNVQFDF